MFHTGSSMAEKVVALFRQVLLLPVWLVWVFSSKAYSTVYDREKEGVVAVLLWVVVGGYYSVIVTCLVSGNEQLVFAASRWWQIPVVLCAAALLAHLVRLVDQGFLGWVLVVMLYVCFLSYSLLLVLQVTHPGDAVAAHVIPLFWARIRSSLAFMSPFLSSYVVVG